VVVVAMTAEGIFSASWYRVAAMRPRLRSHVQIHRHRYRGEIWYVLQDHVSGRLHRFSALSHAFIGVMDGKRTVDEIWRALSERLGDGAPTQDEVVTLLAQLHAADVLVSDAVPDAAELVGRAQRRERSRRLGQWRNPVSVRVPLFDPDRLLGALLPLFGWLFTPAGFALWAVAVGSAVLQAGLHWQELTADITDRVLGLENVLLIALVFPVVKVLHEIGHGLAVKKWHGEVHESGVMLLAFIPTPYVDASAAGAFRSVGQRVVVGAAGMMVELLLAAAALYVWLAVQPGIVRAIAFNTMLVAGISTLVFNGNPLLRYDAYYMLMDWLEMPNLASRANRYLGYLVQRYAFGVPEAVSPVTARGEAPWLVAYAIGSFFYRLLVMLLVSLLIASKYFVVGVVLAVWALGAGVVWPILKQVGYVLSAEQLVARRGRAVSLTAAAAAAIVVLLAAVPLPYRTVAEGVVWTPEESWVRAGAEGVVAEVLVASGERVASGSVLFELEDAVVTARVAMLRGQLDEVGARYDAALASDRVAVASLRAEQDLARERLADALEQEAALTVRSPVDGVLLLPRPAADMPGTFVQRGEPLAYVVEAGSLSVRVVVSQEDVDLVRQRATAVEARLADSLERALPARVIREAPGATASLPSGALTLAGGGGLAVDPAARDDRTAFQSVFLFDLTIAEPIAAAPRLGGRVYVRFDHGAEPLAGRWYRSLRQLFLERLDV
jgi:putative peptide zinc metalloprotease protein